MALEESYRILGIDPGTTVLGYAVLEVGGKQVKSVCALGHLVLDGKRSHFERLGDIHQFMLHLLYKQQPREIAIEAPFFGKNVQSMLKLGRAQGVIIATAMGQQLPVAEYAPREVKQALTGKGNSSKEQVAAMAQRICGPLPAHEKADATDALGVAICHFFKLGDQTGLPTRGGTLRSVGGKKQGKSDWSTFLKANPNRMR